MRVLVTGSTGQVGRALCRRLSAHGPDRSRGAAPGAGPFAVIASGREAGARLHLDLADPGSVVSALEEARPDVVINAAAYTAVDRAEEERERAFAVNAEGPAVLAEEAANRGVPLIHFSTDYVFSGEGSAPWRETDAPAPVNVYGASKLRGDENVLAVHPQSVILRTSWVFGATGENFLTTMLRLGREREELRVVDDQVGAPTSAGFLAEMTARVLGSAGSAAAMPERAGLYHLCCGGETSWYGFAEEIFRQAREVWEARQAPETRPAREALEARRAREARQARNAREPGAALGVRKAGEPGAALRVREVLPVSSSEYPTTARRPLNSRLDCGRFFDTFPGERASWEGALGEVMEELGR